MPPTDTGSGDRSKSKSLPTFALLAAFSAAMICSQIANAANESSALPAAWKVTQQEVATLLAASRYEQAMERISEFIQANPGFGPAYEKRAWLTLDWLDLQDEMALFDAPLRYRPMQDPILAVTNTESADQARRAFLEDWSHEKYVAPAELESVDKDRAACRRLIGASFNDEPLEAFVAEFVGQVGRSVDLVGPRCKDGSATARDYLTYGRVLQRRGDLKGALSAVEVAFKSPEVRSQASFAKANLLLALNRNQDLVLFLERWRDASPRDPRRLFIGISNTKDRNAMFTDIEALGALLPNDASLHFGRATREMQFHQDAELAMRELNQAIELNSTSLLPYYARAGLWARQGNMNMALADATAAIERGPYFNAAYLLRAKIYHKLNDTEAARQDERHDLWLKALYEMHSAYRLNPDNADAACALGRHYARREDWKPALKVLSRCLKSDPKHVEALRLRSVVSVALGKLDPALTDANALVAVSPVPASYSVRGNVFAKRQEWDKAVTDFERANCLDDRLEQALRHRADWHESKGRVDQAKADRERAEKVSQASFSTPN